MGRKRRGSNYGVGVNFRTRLVWLFDPPKLLYNEGLKWSNLSIDHPTPSSAEARERVYFACVPPLGLRGLF
jgi:hypothetical protein